MPRRYDIGHCLDGVVKRRSQRKPVSQYTSGGPSLGMEIMLDRSDRSSVSVTKTSKLLLRLVPKSEGLLRSIVQQLAVII